MINKPRFLPLASLFLLAACTTSAPPSTTIAAPPIEEWLNLPPIEFKPGKPGVFHQSLDWSPSGDYIALSEITGPPNNPDNLLVKIISPGTGDETLVAKGAFNVSWTAPDGKLSFIKMTDGGNDIFWYDPDTSEITQVTHTEENEVDPSWSKDGKKVVYVTGARNERQLNIADADFQNSTVISEKAAAYYGPVWSSDGKSIAFFEDFGNRNDQVYSYEISTGHTVQLSQPETFNVYPHYYNPDIISFVTQNGSQKGVSIVSRSGTTLGFIEMDIRYARFAPDRTKLAVIAGAPPATGIYIIELDPFVVAQPIK